MNRIIVRLCTSNYSTERKYEEISSLTGRGNVHVRKTQTEWTSR
jgi:hypothetical protein